MGIDINLHDWQCNSEEYLLNLPNTGGDFVAYPKWECLNNATITNSEYSVLTLDFAQQSAKLKGTFTVIGEAIDLVIRAGSELYLNDINFINFNKIIIDYQGTQKLWLENVQALNSNGKTTELIANINYLKLSGDIKVDGVTKVTLADIDNVQARLDTNQLKLLSATKIHWDIKSKATTSLYGKIEGVNLNLNSQGSVWINGVVLSNQINASIEGSIVVKKWLETKTGTIQSNSILIQEKGILKVADDGSGDNLLKINLPHSFHNKKGGRVLGGGYDIKSASFQNDGKFNVSSLKLDVEKDFVSNELLTIRNKNGEIGVKGKLFNNNEINAEQGSLKITYNPDNAFVTGKFYGTKGVYIGYPQNYKVSNLTQLNGSGVSEIYSSKGEVKIDAAKWRVHLNQKVVASTVLTINTGSYSLENYGDLEGGKINFKLAQKLINHGTIKYGNGSSVKALEVEFVKGLVSGDGIEYKVNNTFNFIDGTLQGKTGEMVIQAPVINIGGELEASAKVKFITDELNQGLSSNIEFHDQFHLEGLTAKNAKRMEIYSGAFKVNKGPTHLYVDELYVWRSLSYSNESEEEVIKITNVESNYNFAWQYNYPYLTLGTYNIDNYLGGYPCKKYDANITFQVPNKDLIKGFKIVEAGYEDYFRFTFNNIQKIMAPKNGDRLEVIGGGVYTGEQYHGCRASCDWRIKPNIELKQDLLQGTNKIRFELVVGGEGEGWTRIKICSSLMSNAVPVSLNIFGDLYFYGNEIKNEYGEIRIHGNMYLDKFTSINNIARENPGCPNPADPVAFVVDGKIIGKFTDINNVIIQEGIPKSGSIPSLTDGINKIGETANKLVTSNLNGIAVPANQNVAEVVGIDNKRPVTIADQYGNIVDVSKFSGFSRDFYQINHVPTAYKSYYTYYIQEKYPALVKCSYGMAEQLKDMGIPPEKVPPLLCTPNIQANLVSKVMQGLTGASYLISSGNVQGFFNAISDGKNAVSVLEDGNSVDPECLQLEFLLKSCKENAHKYGYSFPNGIEKNNIASIQEPFACPVIKTVNGVEVVSLELYLPQELIRNSFAWYGAFLGAGEWEIEVEGHILNTGTLASGKGGTIITKLLGNFGQMLLASGKLDITVKEKVIIASLIETVSSSYSASSTQKSLASLESINNGEYYIHGEGSALIQGAELSGKIVIEVDGAFFIVPSKLYSAYISSNYQHASLTNQLSKLDGQIRVVADLINGEGVHITPGSSAEFYGKKGVSFVPAFDQEEEWGQYSKKKKRSLSSKKISVTWHNFISTPLGLDLGSEGGPLQGFLAYSEDGDVMLSGAKLNVKELYLKAGTIENPRQVMLLPAVAEELHEVLTVTKSFGLGTSKGQIILGQYTKHFQSLMKNELVPTIVQIEGKAYISSQGQFVQLSSEMHSDGKMIITSPTGYRIEALDSTEINLVKFSEGKVGIGFVASKSELALKQGIEISSMRQSSSKYTPVYSVITANSLLFDGYGVLETKGVVFKYNEAIFKVAKHIDRAAFQKIAQSYKMEKAELAAKIGIRSSLGGAIDSSQNLADQNPNSATGAINTAFSAIAAYAAWMKALALPLPIQGGIWLEGSYSKDELKINKAIPVLSYFSGGTTEHEAEEISFSGTQVKGERWFVSAKEVLLTSAFSSFDMESKSYGGTISFEFLSGALSASMFYNKASASEQNAFYTKIDMQDEIVMEVKGKLALEGAQVQAGKINLNVGQLILRSIHNLSKNSNFGFSISTDLLAKTSQMLSGLGVNVGNGDRKWIDEITMLLGRESTEIVVAGALEIMGAVVANAEYKDGKLTDKGKLYVKAAELFAQDLYGYDDGILLGASVSLAYPDKKTPEGKQSKGSGIGNEYRGDFGYKDLEQSVYATIGQGVLEVGDIHGNINRDLDHIEEHDGIEIEPIHIYWAQMNDDTEDEETTSQEEENQNGEDLARAFRAALEDEFGEDVSDDVLALGVSEARKRLSSLGNLGEDEYSVSGGKVLVKLEKKGLIKSSSGASYMEVAFDIVSSEEARKLGKGVFKVGKHFARLNPVASSVLLAYEIGNYIVEHQPQDIGKIGEITEFAKKVVEKASSVSKLKQEIGGKYGSPNFDPDPDDDGRKEWKIEKHDKAMLHDRYGKFYRDPNAVSENGNKLWWSKDTARHGGHGQKSPSTWKVFEETNEGLRWYKDADKYGQYISEKHKGPVGKDIPWKELRGIK